MNKKYILVATAALVLAIIGFTIWFLSSRGSIPWLGGGVLPLTRTYDIEQDYCGKAIDINYCNCAFQGENCEMIGALNQDAARRLLTAGFEQWVIEKKKEECSQKGGEWVKEKCIKE